MERRFLKTLSVILLLFVCTSSNAQPAFYNVVQALIKKDANEPPPKNAILFTGSSSFTKWTNVQEYFPGYPIVNRAFGGSSIPDLIYYVNQVILPYKPKQVIIYCGDNDLAASDTVTSQMVRDRFIQLFNIIRSNLPKTTITFVSIKPSPSRQQLMPKMQQANKLVAAFLLGKPRTGFVDVYSKMLLSNGQPDPSIFLKDELHMNKKGYEIWQKLLYPYLLK